MEPSNKKQSKQTRTFVFIDEFSIVGENDINLDLTQKLKKIPKYQQLLDWCKENGLKTRSVT